MYDVFKTFRNINKLNEELESGINWELQGVSWIDVDVEDNGEVRTYRNPVMLMKRTVSD